ncbi:unnamed protein product (mitochondrion) [Plasmodiophora brassicae]|uniref:Uncharacterized protein n=1 Tax=Plasmodiophora brassicae TaxID=37360 RepID=A0A0G4IUL3_PLABS|nr:hypothetical protein PBRA_007147 [Plasmodiophora brassicae]SPQ98589.1 unnamed protein product [Plasmodiophora brassicae]
MALSRGVVLVGLLVLLVEGAAAKRCHVQNVDYLIGGCAPDNMAPANMDIGCAVRCKRWGARFQSRTRQLMETSARCVDRGRCKCWRCYKNVMG